mgnify:CR=1 FL=1
MEDCPVIRNGSGCLEILKFWIGLRARVWTCVRKGLSFPILQADHLDVIKKSFGLNS